MGKESRMGVDALMPRPSQMGPSRERHLRMSLSHAQMEPADLGQTVAPFWAWAPLGQLPTPSLMLESSVK